MYQCLTHPSNYTKKPNDRAACNTKDNIDYKREREELSKKQEELAAKAANEFYDDGKKQKAPQKVKKVNEVERKHCNDKKKGKRDW